MKQAKQKRYSFHPRIGRDKHRKSNVIVYKGVNLKYPLDVGALQATGGFIDIPPIWQGAKANTENDPNHLLDFGDIQWRPDGVEVGAMITRVRSNVPIVCHVGVLTDSQDVIRTMNISLTSPYENC